MYIVGLRNNNNIISRATHTLQFSSTSSSAPHRITHRPLWLRRSQSPLRLTACPRHVTTLYYTLRNLYFACLLRPADRSSSSSINIIIISAHTAEWGSVGILCFRRKEPASHRRTPRDAIENTSSTGRMIVLIPTTRECCLVQVSFPGQRRRRRWCTRIYSTLSSSRHYTHSNQDDNDLSIVRARFNESSNTRKQQQRKELAR